MSVELCQRLESVFFGAFGTSFNTVLVGGAVEPLYQPSETNTRPHTIFYREDYPASALHEIAHWCVAGEERRKLIDFGYWYQPDGRTAEQQSAFERVEIKPQALEWVFSEAVGLKFSVSADNLSGETGASEDFVQAVCRQAEHWCVQGLPSRAGQLADALLAEFQLLDKNELINPGRYRQLPGALEQQISDSFSEAAGMFAP